MNIKDEDSTRREKVNSVEKNGGVSPGSKPKTAGDFLANPDGENQASSSKDYSSNSASLSGLLQRLLGCLRPVWTILGKASKEQKSDPWTIPFDEIYELEWLGSGAQGAVFLGQYGGQQVAVKKVRREADTDIKHLRNINHPNIVKFRGICNQAPVHCIIMEFCPNGQLYEVLRNGRQITPSLLIKWSKQIADGMHYLHLHKIIHRDLKSPNVLVGEDDLLKISDFGTCKEFSEKSAKMTFAGTVAWMAPEVIRNEPCSEKVDVWSFGVLLWELLTGEMPYRDVDSSAIIWGVGSNSLHLPVPTTCPEGFKLLMKLCWNSKPKNRPSFQQVLLHVEIAAGDVLNTPQEIYLNKQITWRGEIKEEFQKMKNRSSAHMQNLHQLQQLDEELIRRRKEELRHARDIRVHYEQKLERANNLYQELNECMQHLEAREKELLRRERQLKLENSKKRVIKSELKARTAAVENVLSNQPVRKPSSSSCPNTSSSSSSPTERTPWPQEGDSEDQERQNYARKMKRSRSCLSKSKRRRSPGTPSAGTQDVDEFMTLQDSSLGLKKGPCCNGSLQGHSWDCTDKMAPCSCSDSDHDLAACRRTCDKCPFTTGSPISIPRRKAKRRRWNSNSESSCESKHLSPRVSSSDEMSDLEPQFIPKLTNDSIELTEDEQFTNVILQFSESCLEEESRVQEDKRHAITSALSTKDLPDSSV
ncbi:hypothetical protein ACROYT_G035790 [Oculina patagonica]